MAHFHLLSTRRNSDGSFDTPSFDEVIHAQDAATAVSAARQFPTQQFGVDSHVTWLVDQDGRVVWAQDHALPDAA